MENLDSDELEALALEEEARKRKVIEDAELQAIINSEGGRFFLWRLLSEAGVFRTNASDDALAMSFREGRRSIGLWLLHLLESVDPNGFAKVRIEALNRQREAELSTNQGMENV